MKKIFTTITFFLVFPFFLFAQAADTQSLIQSLQEQIAALQARIAELRVSEENVPLALHAIERNLFQGVEGDDVRYLQEFLAKDKNIYPEGLITGYYGPLTEKAVQRWQVKERIVASGTSETTGYGRIGPKTRARLNELFVVLEKSPSVEEKASLSTEIVPSIPLAGQATSTPIESPESSTGSTETAPPVKISPKPTPNIKSGAGSAITNSVFDFGTGVIHYKEVGRLGESGAFYLGNAGGGRTSPLLFVASVTSPKGNACDPHDGSGFAGMVGPRSICEFNDAANYTFSNTKEAVRFHEKGSSCYDGIVLFRQNGLYGGIEPEDITKSGDLTYRYWYDASGGSDFSDVCLLGKNSRSRALASVLDSLADILDKIQREIKKLPL